jgi:hypothetical protein
MDKQQIVADLLSKGMSQVDAEAFADKLGAEPRADVDALRKGLADIAASNADKYRETEQLRMDLDAIKDGSSAVVDALVKGSDLLLNEHRSQNAVIADALGKVLDRLDALDVKLAAQGETLTKGTLNLSGDAPQRKSQVGLQPVKTPAEAANGGAQITAAEFATKANAKIAMLGDSQAERSQADMLRKGVSLIYSAGVDRNALAKQLGIEFEG